MALLALMLDPIGRRYDPRIANSRRWVGNVTNRVLHYDALTSSATHLPKSERRSNTMQKVDDCLGGLTSCCY